MIPLRDLVLLQLSASRGSASGHRDDGTKFTLYLPAQARHELPLGRVLALGPEASTTVGLRVGATVLFDEARATRVDSNDTLKVGRAATGNTLALDGPGRVVVALADILAIINRNAKEET